MVSTTPVYVRDGAPSSLENSTGVCKRESANVDVQKIRKFRVVVPAAYPHLFLYLSQGHSLTLGLSPELGRRALSKATRTGRGGAGGEAGAAWRPQAGRARTCPAAA